MRHEIRQEQLDSIMAANGGVLPPNYWTITKETRSRLVKEQPTRKPKKLGVTDARQALFDKADEGIDSAKNALQELYDDMEEKRSNMEEHFSGTERYSRFEEACDALEEAIGNLDSVDVSGIELP